MTLQEALTHPNVVRFELWGSRAPMVNNTDDIIRFVREPKEGVRVVAVWDSGARSEIRAA